LLCGALDWESDEGDEGLDSESDASDASELGSETTGRADLSSVTLPTPTTEELELFGDSVRFGQNE
jgi:hypothetical protein